MTSAGSNVRSFILADGRWLRVALDAVEVDAGTASIDRVEFDAIDAFWQVEDRVSIVTTDGEERTFTLTGEDEAYQMRRVLLVAIRAHDDRSRV